MAVPPSPLPVDSFLSIHAVRVYVRNVDRSLQFYVEKLGFRLEGTARSGLLHRGVRRDGWVAGLLPGELL